VSFLPFFCACRTALAIGALLVAQTGAFAARPARAADAPAVIRIETSDYDLSAEPSYGVAAGIFARTAFRSRFNQRSRVGEHGS